MPVLVSISPADGSLTAAAEVTLSGQLSGAASLSIDGAEVPLQAGAFSFGPVALAEGERVFVLTATAGDGSGDVLQLAHRVVRDSTAPQISLTRPAEGAVIGASPLVVEGQASDPHLAEVRVGGVPASVTGTSFSAAVPLEPGPQSVSITATDAVGNAASISVAVTLDPDPPQVTITDGGAPLPDGAVLARAVTPVVTVADATAATLDLQLDGTAFVSGTAVSAEGAHLLTAVARDAAGHETAVSRAFTIDVTAPEIAGVSPAEGTLTAAATVTLSGRAAGAASVTVNGEPAILAADAFTAGPLPLAEGENLFAIAARDAAGNQASLSRTVVRDATAPAITVASPAAGAVVGASPVVVSGRAADAHLASVTVAGAPASLTGQDFTASVALTEGANALAIVAADGAGNEAQTSHAVTLDTLAPQLAITAGGAPLHDGAVFAAAPVVDVTATDATAVTVEALLDGAPFAPGSTVGATGQHLLEVTATDEAGNATTAVVAFSVDQTAPILSQILPPSNSVQREAEVTISGVAMGATSVTVDGRPAQLAGEDWTIGPLPLVEGSNRFVIVASDDGGNRSERFHVIIRDTVAPVLRIDTPRDGLVVRESPVEVTGAVSEPHIRSITISGTPARISGGAFSGSLPLAEGPNLFVVRALDRAGNASELSRTVSLDTLPPELTVDEPAAGTVTPAERIVLRGTAADPHLDRVEVNGLRATLAGNAWSLEVLLAEGVNVFQVAAIDVAGNQRSASRSISRDSQAPVVAITSPADGARVNAAAVSVSGTVSDEPGVLVAVNGLPATVTGGTFSIDAIPLAEGENRILARATDLRGNSGSHTRIVVRDSLPPELASSLPAAGALAIPPETVFRLTFSEPLAPLAGGAVRLEDDAGAAIPATVELAGEVVTVMPQAPLPSRAAVRLVLAAAVTDRAGNALQPSALDFTVADVGAPEPPVLDALPPSHLCAPEVVLAGSAEPGTTVRVIGGLSLASTRADDATGAFRLTVTLSRGTRNRLQITARDVFGNVSPALEVAVTHDCEPPQVTGAGLNGGVLQVTFNEAMDPATLPAAVAVELEGAPAGGTVEVAADGLSATFLPASPLPPAPVRLSVATSATDLAGNALAFPWSGLLGSELGESFLSGTVIDDATGRPLAGARVVITATDGVARALPLPELTTGDDGRFLMAVGAGTHELTIARPGYSPVFRIVTTQAGLGADVFDPRLMPVSAADVLGAAGGTVESDGLRLLLPAGALAAATELSVTAVGEQALPALLPYGWSPRGAAWIDAGDAPLAVPATLELPVDAPDGTVLVLASLDLATLQWRAAGEQAAAGGKVLVELSATGAYAALEADAGELAPPPPVAGEVLGSSPRPAGDEVLAAEVTFEPPVVLPMQTAVATVTYVMNAPAASGLPLTLSIQEELTLRDGTVRRSAPYRADLVLYRDPAGQPRSRFRLQPSTGSRFLPVASGQVRVTVLTFGDESVRGNVLGPAGGTVTSLEGDRAEVPAGALTSPTAVLLNRRAAADLPLGAPRGAAIDGVLELDLGGRILDRPATLALTLPAPPAAGDAGLLLQVIDVSGRSRYRAVAELQATANGWQSAAIDPADLPWPGVTSGGLFAFVRLSVPHAFLRGTALDAAGAPLAGGLVEADAVDWVQLTAADGRYVLPLPLGDAVVTLTNPANGNGVDVAVTATGAGARLDLDPQLEIRGPFVTEITPAAGAVVPQGIEPILRFSEPVDRTSLALGIALVDDAGTPVEIDFDHQGARVTVLPRSILAPGRTYELRVSSAVTDLFGFALDPPVTSAFTTQTLELPATVDPSRIFLLEPDPQGIARVRGFPGAAPAGTLVFVENTSAFVATESVNVRQDGAFELNVAATVGDRILLHVIILGGNEVLLELGPYMGEDLQSAVAEPGGTTLTTADGIVLDVPPGAFDAPT
ncbi:MAG: hypothetical protein D6696_05820, partial [Acidobacteria bacterium]